MVAAGVGAGVAFAEHDDQQFPGVVAGGQHQFRGLPKIVQERGDHSLVGDGHCLRVVEI